MIFVYENILIVDGIQFIKVVCEFCGKSALLPDPLIHNITQIPFRCPVTGLDIIVLKKGNDYTFFSNGKCDSCNFYRRCQIMNDSDDLSDYLSNT